MHNFLLFTVIGISYSGFYAISACGLVLTYTASGIFNFAHGAFGMMAAFTFWQFHTQWGWGTVPSLLLVVFVIAPLFGAVVERGIMRGLEGTSEVVKIVVTVSLMLALIGLASVWWPTPGFNQLFFAGHSVSVAGVNVGYHQILTLAIALLVAVGLRVFLYRTRVGISMRAVVDDRPLLQLNGGRPYRSASMAWALGAGLAAIAGILASPATIVGLDALNLSLLVVNTFAAAVIGRLKSLPMAFAGAVFIGLSEAYIGHYTAGHQWFGYNLDNIRFAISPIILFIMLVLLPHARLRAGGVQGVRERWRVPTVRTAAIGGAVLIVATLAITDLVTKKTDLIGVVPGVYLAIVMLSLVPLTGYAGQISLAQLSFAAIGALVMAGVGADKTPAGLIVAVVVCAAVGALVALPALRLSGIYLALATASFGLVMEKVVLSQQKIMPGGNKFVPPLDLGFFKVKSAQSQLFLLVVAFAIIGVGLIALRRSSFGRRLAAMKDSPMACATLGLDLTTTKIAVFALSAAIAGLGGALLTGTVSSNSSFTLTQSLSVTMMAVVGGVGAIGGVFLGGMLLGALGLTGLAGTVFATNSIGLFQFWDLTVAHLLAFTPGFIGIGLGRNPSGAISDIGDAYRQVGESRPALGCSIAGPVILWVLARSHTISNWTFVATLVVFVLAVVPLLPVLFTPIQGGRAALTGGFLVAAVVAVGCFDWGTLIASNGMRFLVIILITVVTAGAAFPIHGAMPARAEPGPSPDLLGVDRPLAASDILEADVALGIDEGMFHGAA
jgi:branched-subunit amino acid ABC-type transport system permease component